MSADNKRKTNFEAAGCSWDLLRQLYIYPCR